MFGFLEMKQGGGQSSLTFGGDGTTHTVWEVILGFKCSIVYLAEANRYFDLPFSWLQQWMVRSSGCKTLLMLAANGFVTKGFSPSVSWPLWMPIDA